MEADEPLSEAGEDLAIMSSSDLPVPPHDAKCDNNEVSPRFDKVEVMPNIESQYSEISNYVHTQHGPLVEVFLYRNDSSASSREYPNFSQIEYLQWLKEFHLFSNHPKGLGQS